MTTTIRKLPQIDLSKFSGYFADWVNFRDLFLSMVHANSILNNADRLHYLKTNTSGDADILISNITTSGDNFARVWEVLIKRYDNKRLLVYAHLNALTPLQPVTGETATELKRFLIGTVNSCEALEQHKQKLSTNGMTYWFI